MTQADCVLSTPPTNTSAPLTEVANGLAELETPLLRVRALIYAARLLAGSSEIGGDPGLALDALADTALEEIEGVVEERHRLWLLALGREGGSDAEA